MVQQVQVVQPRRRVERSNDENVAWIINQIREYAQLFNAIDFNFQKIDQIAEQAQRSSRKYAILYGSVLFNNPLPLPLIMAFNLLSNKKFMTRFEERMKVINELSNSSEPGKITIAGMVERVNELLRFVDGVRYSSDVGEHNQIKDRVEQFCLLVKRTDGRDLSADNPDEYAEFRKYADLFMNVQAWEYPNDIKQRLYGVRDILLGMPQRFTAEQRKELKEVAQILGDHRGLRLSQEQKEELDDVTGLFWNRVVGFDWKKSEARIVQTQLQEYNEQFNHRQEYWFQNALDFMSFSFKAGGAILVGSALASGSLLAGTMVLASVAAISIPLAPVIFAGWYGARQLFSRRAKREKAFYHQRLDNTGKDYNRIYKRDAATLRAAKERAIQQGFRIKPDEMNLPQSLSILFARWANNRFMRRIEAMSSSRPRQGKIREGLVDVSPRWKRFIFGKPNVPAFEMPESDVLKASRDLYELV